MTEIVKHSGLLVEQPPVKKVEKSDLFQVVNAEIGKCFADAGHSIPDTEEGRANRAYLVNQVVKDVQTYTPNLRLEEIGIAFRNGVRGKYGEYFGLSVVTFNKFLVGYLSSGERDQRILREAEPEPEPKPPAPEEYDTRCMGHLKDAFKAVSDGEFFEDTGNFLYRWLDDKGAIPFNKERKAKFMADAEQQIIAEKELEKKTAPDYLKRKQLALLIENIQNRSRQGLVKSRAMKLALNQYIKDQLEFGGTPESIFNNE